MSRTSCDTSRVVAASALLLFVTASCTRRDEEASKPAPQATATQGSGERGTAALAEPQPDFIKHPPVHLKPACASSSESTTSDEGHRCVALTLRCPELDPGESVWLATTPPVAKVVSPKGARGLHVTGEDEVSARVCCKNTGAAPEPVKAQIRLFTNEVAGSVHTLDCP
ncbi:hypothetical protein [Polyangium spumosum]|uniref:Uncharacterized protein n=1 Tax=Polyangium spumosum TaxID=889282 RepID=A0A6N7PKQ1_9BACT|nr:hypothetical protein [Polyangium spumosum]MRG91416.1 hypothetical protein [Polyangium spumosum]